MTIQEAIKSGKPFRRSGCDYWTTVDIHGNIRTGGESGTWLTVFSTDDILATDWEVKLEPMVIYVNIHEGYGYAYDSKDRALVNKFRANIPTRKFVEVIE